MTRNLL